MNTEDIIRMYAKANGWSPAAFTNTLEELERFAALVASAEREACAKVCDVLAYHPEFESDATKLAAMAIRARGQE